ncbi:MAG: ATP-dependent exoDNAse (exonuclease V) beta subunit (contains helicase and exonuclease domains) [Phormidium sp. OSCR]|nr:MAG: ATP-dependent exoDNAse (exonuclease V) beta subunit (contains helicase and exonuclease domains) [Phormidium sp. OSCR]
MPLTPEQHQAVYAKGSVAITAGAGTGKTYMLAQRYLHHLRDDGYSPLEVVAVTFTEKAALELRSRIREMIAQEMPDNLEIIAELEAAPICTFHSLAAQICRDRALDLGIPPDFRVLDAIESQLWFDEASLKILNRLPEHLYEQVPYHLLEAILPQLLDDPLSVQAAFENSPDSWPSLAQQLQDQIFDEILSQPLIQESLEILPRYSGSGKDTLEPARQQVYTALCRLQGGERSPQLLKILIERNFNREQGKKTNWKGGGLELIRQQLKDLRDLAKKHKNELNALQLGELDADLARLLPPLREAFNWIYRELQTRKCRDRVLCFADLEIYALEALQDERIRREYGDRFQAILVDEFQDTNPTQGKLLNALSQTATLTIVGDEKQSIYSFRRADMRVFAAVRQHIQQQGGSDVALSLSFRTHHRLLQQINQIFRPLLGQLHQSLQASRQEIPHSEPDIEVFCLQEASELSKAQKRAAEAYKIAQLVCQWLNQGEVAAGDIAILARTHAPLGVYGEALEAVGVPIALAGGGSLLETREAKDAMALFEFLCYPDDDRALVALLRSPFFALSDRALLLIKQQTDGNPSLTWWQRLQQVDWASLDCESEEIPDISPLTVLEALRKFAQEESPARVLQEGDRLTGYTAVLANLPSSRRRLADWRGFREFVRELEGGDRSLYPVVRRLQRLRAMDAAIPRLPLDASNAVSLMTIHGSKGLEWKRVILGDLSVKSSARSDSVLFDPEIGLAVRFSDDFEREGKPFLYVYLQRLQRQLEDQESLRLLYVALTRSRDKLVLTACEPEGGFLEKLQPGFDAAAIPLHTWELPQDDDLSFSSAPPPEPPPLTEILLTDEPQCG